jgi:hypothetical protein
MPQTWKYLRGIGICFGCFLFANSAISQNYSETHRPSPFYQKFALGMGMDLPDIFPIEGLWWTKYFGARVFYAPAFPFDVRVEMPADVISSSRGIQIEHPELNIKLDALYGANYGAEFSFFPFAGSFFLNLGLSQRSFRLAGEVKSPLIIRPQGAEESITTRTVFGLRADARTESLLLRASAGWIWRILDSFYWRLAVIGVAKPTKTRSTVKVDVLVESPTTEENVELAGALAELRDQKESELSDKAHQQIRPVEDQLWPIIGLSVGYVF